MTPAQLAQEIECLVAEVHMAEDTPIFRRLFNDDLSTLILEHWEAIVRALREGE